ncbi:MAG: hypothetical protein AB1679_08450 [Actinomycetota bacterium]
MSPKPLRPAPKVPAIDRKTSIALETEPLVYFHPTLVGRARPGKVQPVPHRLLLEEEPATWPQVGP